jgi:poly(glycerol-phosphate) alpha-glucosyltransferase
VFVEEVKIVSLVGSISRRAGGLFESVRRLDQEIMSNEGDAKDRSHTTNSLPSKINVSVLGIRDECTDVDCGSWFPVSVQAFPCVGPRAFGYAPGLADRLSELGADLVHVHGLWQFTSLAALGWHRRGGRPYVVSPHGMLDGWALRNARWKKQLGWLAYEKLHLQSAACLRALCAGEAEAIRRLGLARPICVIPNGVDLPRAAGPPPPRGRDGLGLNDRKVLLYLGRLHPKKGLVPLLRAWKEVGPASWSLVIAGWEQNHYESTLREVAGELGLCGSSTPDQASQNGSVHFIGPQFGNKKAEWLRRCDAFVLPSLSEGLPMAVLEAWAFGKPVLISDHCNLPEGVAVGAAIRIEATSGGIAAGLRSLFKSNDSALHEMGCHGRSLVQAKYSWSNVTAEMRQVYEWILGSRCKPACVLT